MRPVASSCHALFFSWQQTACVKGLHTFDTVASLPPQRQRGIGIQSLSGNSLRAGLAQPRMTLFGEYAQNRRNAW